MPMATIKQSLYLGGTSREIVQYQSGIEDEMKITVLIPIGLLPVQTPRTLNVTVVLPTES